MATQATIGGNECYVHYDSNYSGYFHTYDTLSLYHNDQGRQINVYLPMDYETSGKTYPVVYMNDGHAIFWTGGIGGNWNQNGVLSGLYNNDAIQQVIIVAVHLWNLNNRNDEYLHVKFRDFHGPLSLLNQPLKDVFNGALDGGGYLDGYSDYLVRLKNFIDMIYRTKSDKHNTAIIGSSHGGLAAFYTACKHKDHFGKCAAMSPSFWVHVMNDLRKSELIRKVDPYLRDQKGNLPTFWIDWGMVRKGGLHNQFIEDWVTKYGRQMVEILQKDYGYKQNENLYHFEDPLGQHSEISWSHRLGYVLETFFRK